MDAPELRRELDRLRQRLQRIERQLGIVADTQAMEPDTVEPDHRRVPPIISLSSLTDSHLRQEYVPQESESVEPLTDYRKSEAATPLPMAHQLFSPHAPAPISAEPPEPTGSKLEFLIGGRVMAWVGAITVVVAVGFFVKLAYDQGWLGRLPPLARCGIAGFFGLMLIVAGEYCLRRIGRPAAVGLFSAGLGTLYLTTLAAYRYFELLTQVGAFALLAMVALAGFALTIRGRMLVIGVLSVLAGYLSPILLAGDSSSPVALPIYLTMLLGISLALSAARWRFVPLRYVALAAHGVVGWGWVQSEAAAHSIHAMVFASIWWCMVAAESLRTARLERAAVGNVVCTLLATFWYATAGCWVLDRVRMTGSDLLGLFSVAIAVASAALAMRAGSGWLVLRRRPRTATEKLTVALWVQAGILYASSIALEFQSFGQTIGWLATAVGCIEIGRRLRARGVDVFGLIVGTLALLRLVSLDFWLPILRLPLFVSEYLVITPWSLLALSGIVALQLAALRIRIGRRGEWAAAPIALAAMGTLGWLCLCAVQARELAMTCGWLTGGALLLSFASWGRRQRYLELGLLVLVVTAGRWLIFDTVLPRLSPGWDALARWPVLNAQMGMAAAIVLCSAWATRILRRRTEEATRNEADIPALWQWVFLACSVLMLTALSFELDRTVVGMFARGGSLAWSLNHLRQILLTLLWSIGGIAVGLIGRVRTARRDGVSRSHSPLVQFGWCLLMICAIKFILIDSLYVSVWGGQRPTVKASQLPFLNVSLLTTLVLSAGAIVLGRGMHGRSVDDDADMDDSIVGVETARFAEWLPVAASLLLLWGLSFEVDRLIGLLESSGGRWAWPAVQFRALWITLLWGVGGWAMCVYGRWRPWRSLGQAGMFLVCGAATAWLTYDTLLWRMGHVAVQAGLVFNLQFFSGIALLILMASCVRRLRGLDDNDVFRTRRIAAALTLALAIGLWLGSLEIDRCFAPGTNRVARMDLARHTGFSVYWGLYGIGLVALGFARRIARCRQAGLVLLSLTLVKVLLVDLAGVGYAYRVLSLLAVGMLLVATSVAYVRLAPRFLELKKDEIDGDAVPMSNLRP